MKIDKDIIDKMKQWRFLLIIMANSMTEIVINILQGRAVTQNTLVITRNTFCGTSICLIAQ